MNLRAIQSLINSRAKFVFVPKGVYDCVAPLKFYYPTKIYWEPGSVVTWHYKDKQNAVEFASGVNWEAYGCTFQMNWTGSLPMPNDSGNPANILHIEGLENVTIMGGTYKKAIIDGIFLGPIITSPGTRINNKNISITDIVCEENRRQGMSITSANGLRVRWCKFNNTRGISPQAGIDIEPDHPRQSIVDVQISNCSMYNNASHNYVTNLHRHMSTISEPVSIAFTNCTAKGNPPLYEVKIEEGTPTGRITWDGQTIWANPTS